MFFLVFLTTARVCDDVKAVYSASSCCINPQNVVEKTRAEMEMNVIDYVERSLTYGQKRSLDMLSYQDSTIDLTVNFHDSNKLTWLASVGKSVFGAAIGIAEKEFPGIVSTPVSECLPTDMYSGNVLEKATLDSLINMKAGLVGDEFQYKVASNSVFAKQYNATYANLAILIAGVLPEEAPFWANLDPSINGDMSGYKNGLYDPYGNPIQLRRKSQSVNYASPHAEWVDFYDSKKENDAAYSSAGFNLASACFQKVLATRMGRMEALTQLEVEKWIRSRLFVKLGYPGTRLAGNGKTALMGTSLYASKEFCIALMRFFFDDGKVGDEQIADLAYMRQYREYDRHSVLKNSAVYGMTFFRGVWTSKDGGYGFAGAGGLVVYGDRKTRRISTMSRSTVQTSALTMQLSDFSTPVSEYFRFLEFESLFLKYGTDQIWLVNSSTIKSCTGLLVGEDVSRTVWGETLYGALAFWKTVLTT